MTVAPAAWVAAAAAGVLTAVLAMRGLRGGVRAAVVLAALVRGAAVALAVVAASGPVMRMTSRVAGQTLVAAPRDADVPAGAATRRWPADAPDAAAATESLRALRDAASPATLVLVAGADMGRGADDAPVARALRKGDDLRRLVRPLPATEPPPRPREQPRVIAPAGAVEGVPVILTLDAGDEPLGAPQARIEVDGRAVTVAIADGAHRAAAPPLDLAAGTHVVVADVAGRLPAAAIVDVAGPPHVLVVSAAAGRHDIVDLLRTQGVDVADLPVADLAADQVERFAAIVLGPGVAGDPLASAVAARVRGGAGLLVLGGDGRAGLSRLRDTPVDALLPVEPPPPPAPPPEPPAPPPPEKKPDPSLPKPALDEGDKEALRVALLLVIDTSGSMAGTKLSMAQQSAVAAAGALAPADRVAVFAFDDDTREIAPFQDAVDMPTLFRKIGGLRAGGGTNFYPALKTGYARILAQPCGIRHVILLTDGETRPAVFGDLVQSGVAKGVTLSTIAIGGDADTELLARLATWGRGKMYTARDPARLPEVVTLDTQRFTTDKRDEAKKNRPKVDAEDLPTPPVDAPPVDRGPAPPEPPREIATAKRPRVATPATFLAGLENETWPQLPFAETTPARPASQVVLAWDDASPALTIGRAGLGRVAVVSAGAASPEAREFVRWPAASQFLAQLVRGLVEPPAPVADATQVEFVEALDGRAFVRVAAAGGGDVSLVPLRSGGPVAAHCGDRGAYSIAELPAMPPAGVYAGTFEARGAPPRRVVAVSAGPRPLPADAARAVADAAGARVVDVVPPPKDGAPVERDEPCEWVLAAAAAGLLLAEAALRRVARRAA